MTPPGGRAGVVAAAARCDDGPGFSVRDGADPHVSEGAEVAAGESVTLEGTRATSLAEEPETADINDAWTCPICLTYFNMPVAPPCQHSFCGGCLKSVVRASAHRHPRNGAQTDPVRPACPLCRETFNPEAVVPNARIFEEMLRATVACRNGDCTAQFCPLRWKHHQEECPAATVQCTHQVVGCAWGGARRDLANHVECCPYEKIKGLIPRVSASLKQIHTQVHQLEARVMAQNAAVANTRAFVMGMHQREMRGSVFPATYALLWRPQDWRRYSCPNPGGVLANACIICLAPIVFLALWGAGMFAGGGGLSAEQQVVCLVGVAVLTFLGFLEYDNGTPWHQLQHPVMLKGIRVGPTLLETSTRFVVYCAIKGLPPWKRLAAVSLMLAPLTYPTVVQGFHRFQVKLKNAQSQAQLAQAQPSLPPRELATPSTIKVHAPVVNGAVRAAAMLLLGVEAVVVGQVLCRLGLCTASAAIGPNTLDAVYAQVRVATEIDASEEEKEHVRQLHRNKFGPMKAPFTNLRDRRARVCVGVTCLCLFTVLTSIFRDSIETIGYSLILLSCLDGTHLRWEVHVGRWVMASLEQTSTRLAQDPEHERNPALDLLRSRVLLLWIVVGSVFFVLLFLSS